jgi:fibronectin type 3 domain-containing protein
MKMTWINVKGAKNYLVYSSKCGTKYKYIKKTSAKSYTQRKLKKGTYYKYLVIAVDANGKKLAASKVIHVAAKGGKNAHVTCISVNKKTIK